LIRLIHSRASFRYASSDVRFTPVCVLRQAGKPPPDTSALMYGPGRAITYRPARSASSRSRSTSRMPLKSYEPGLVEWYPQSK
jgi:hypothetical protein